MLSGIHFYFFRTAYAEYERCICFSGFIINPVIFKIIQPIEIDCQLVKDL